MSRATAESMSFEARPAFEGANIRTWIGFKHLMYVVEAAVLRWFEKRDLALGRLYHEHGLGLEIIDCSVQLPAPVEYDDELIAEVNERRAGRFTVVVRARRRDSTPVVIKGNVTVAFVRETTPTSDGPPPPQIASLVVPEVAAAWTSDAGDLVATDPTHIRAIITRSEPASLVWSWRARYFLCHFSNRVQHSAYVRALEEVVDRFLAERGLSIRQMLEVRGWIPVVSRARVQLIADARMEETVHTRFAVVEIIKNTAYDARMDCFVLRQDALIRVATARILHGYAVGRGDGAGALVELDPRTLDALTDIKCGLPA